MVDRYTEWAEWTGWADEWADRSPCQGTGAVSADGNHNLAKVRVAGSNPVVRSKKSCSGCCVRSRWAAGCPSDCPSISGRDLPMILS